MPHSNRYARPRGEAARKLKEELGWSDRQIGKYFGGFHPSTILSCRRPRYEKKRNGPEPLTRENLLRQVWDLRRRVEWLEQRAGLPPLKVGQRRSGEELIPILPPRKARGGFLDDKGGSDRTQRLRLRGGAVNAITGHSTERSFYKNSP